MASNNNFETIRRFMIVQMNEAGLDSLERARVLQMIQRNLSGGQLEAVAEAITAWRNDPAVPYRVSDLVHDVMGLARRDVAFLPRITSIAEAA